MIARRIIWGLMLMLSSTSAMAQVVDDAKFYSCLRQSGPVIKPYDAVYSDGSISGYRFRVNDLFLAGMCTGQAPAFSSYNWQLCDFKGPAAVANRVSSVDQLLQRPDLQDRLIQDIIVKKSIANRNLMLSSNLSEFQRYRNGADLLGSLLYRKGAAAVKLYALTDINSADKFAYTTRDYIKFFGSCAGSNQPGRERQLFADNEKRSTTPLQMAAKTAPVVNAAAENLPWQPLNNMAADTKDKILHKVPELRLVFGTTEKHLYAETKLSSDEGHDMMLRLTGPDFCSSQRCTYYFFRNNFKDVVIFYAGSVRTAAGQDGFYIDGFYKTIGEIGK